MGDEPVVELVSVRAARASCGIILIPRVEVHSLACNVLAVWPGVVVMLDGNHVTQRELERHGVEVHTFSGREISLNGSGGPTCLTRPVHRA